jgi:hypothetical protein
MPVTGIALLLALIISLSSAVGVVARYELDHEVFSSGKGSGLRHHDEIICNKRT